MDVHDYDPFGAEIDALNTGAMNNFLYVAANSPYKYGGKEWNETTSTYDFKARQLSPNFHRFTTMDPLAEKYYGVSPYAYCTDDPVSTIDPNGCVDWKLVGTGALNLVCGSFTAIGGAAIVWYSGGAGSLYGGSLFLEGGGQAVFGFTKMIVGLASDPSEETEALRKDAPNSPSDAVALLLDNVFGNDNGEIRTVVNTATTIASWRAPLPSEMNSVLKSVLEIEGTVASTIAIRSIVQSDTGPDNSSVSEKRVMTDEEIRSYQYSEGQEQYLWYGQ